MLLFLATKFSFEISILQIVFITLATLVIIGLVGYFIVKLLLHSKKNTLHKKFEKFRRLEKALLRSESSSFFVHEFNNHLSIIRNYSQLIQLKSNNDKVVGFGKIIMEQTDKSHFLTKSLSITGTEAENQSVVEPVDMALLIEDIAGVFDMVYGKKKDKIVIKIKQKVLVSIVKLDIEQILLSLMKNAQYEIKNKNKGSITIELLDTNKKVIIRVGDNGNGINNNKLQEIFKPEYTKKHEPQHFKMAAVRINLTKLGGTISASSKLGEGTVFEIGLLKLQ